MIKTITTLLCLSTSFSLYANQVCEADHIESTSPSTRYTDHANGTITDNETGLMWQTCSITSHQAKNLKQCDKPIEYTWGEALSYISQHNAGEKIAGFTDWRLPNIRELATLAELQCFRPAINLSAFPETPPSHYWSSSPYKFYPHYSWYVNFEDGVYNYSDRTDKKHIRLVRSNN